MPPQPKRRRRVGHTRPMRRERVPPRPADGPGPEASTEQLVQRAYL